MALRQTGRVAQWFGARYGAAAANVEGSFAARSFSTSDEERNGNKGFTSSLTQVEKFVAKQPLGLGAARSPLLAGSNLTLSTPFALSQTRGFLTAPQVQSGSATNSFLLGVYRFWRSQAPMEKAPAPVDARLLPGVIKASDERANIGMWCTTLFFTILSCNLLGLMPFNEAPTSGLGFSTGLGVSVWAAATTLGFYKMGLKFPGHFIPGGTPWPMAFIFVPLETISYSFRAVSLGVRLWVNMLAGHTLCHILTGMSLALPFSLPFYSAIPATFGVCTLLSALVGLEYLVAVLQSGVFSILSSVYIGEFNSAHLATPLAKVVKNH